ncbi:MAG: putative N6-adenine-specific DNA methylase [Planctomycetota bacterium]
MTDTFPLFASCLPGLEPFLLEELSRQYVDAKAVPGGATFTGNMQTVMRACLWLGTASHVRIRLAQFRCRALGELQRKAAELPWREWLSGRVPVALTSRSHRSRVYHTGGISERIYNAIGGALGKPPTLARDEDETVAGIAARFDEDVCTISLDATTTPLHRRGYRLDGRKAPLREDIAHALVLASDWSPDTAMLDPFCGSGTIAIEAAGLAMGLAPGRLRPPAMQQTARFDIDAWHEVVAEGTARDPVAPIAASDRDEGAIEATRQNAERAGVQHAIQSGVHALAAQPWLEGRDAPATGTLITNPPYGIRIQNNNNLLPLYQTLGHRLKSLGDGWKTMILAHDMRLARRTGVELAPAFTTKHGGLAVTAMGSATGEESTEDKPAQPD